jgi:nucleoid-associated protein YgaU
MTLHFSVRGVNYRRPGIALFWLLAPLSLHTKVAAQDVAEAAREQQTKKSQKPASHHHVYTEEDLKRARILTPEDQKQVAVRKQNASAATSEQAAAPAAPPSTSPPESLGEVARRYRREKALRQAETAATKNAPSPLRVELPGTALAEPGRSIAPLRVPPSAAAPALVAPSSAGSRRAPVSARVSPFQPRPSPASPVSPKSRGNPSTLPSREFQQVQVQPGDSLWRMARQYLGDGARWQELLTFNPGLLAHPDSLAAGSTVIVPGAAKSRRAPGAPPTITVQPGDTLWSLARAHLGRGSAWPRLGRANPQLSDYLHLRLGSPVHLPPP